MIWRLTRDLKISRKQVPVLVLGQCSSFTIPDPPHIYYLVNQIIDTIMSEGFVHYYCAQSNLQLTGI